MPVTFSDKKIEARLKSIGEQFAKAQGKTTAISKRAVVYLVLQKASTLRHDELYEFCFARK